MAKFAERRTKVTAHVVLPTPPLPEAIANRGIIALFRYCGFHPCANANSARALQQADFVYCIRRAVGQVLPAPVEHGRAGLKEKALLSALPTYGDKHSPGFACSWLALRRTYGKFWSPDLTQR